MHFCCTGDSEHDGSTTYLHGRFAFLNHVPALLWTLVAAQLLRRGIARPLACTCKHVSRVAHCVIGSMNETSGTIVCHSSAAVATQLYAQLVCAYTSPVACLEMCYAGFCPEEAYRSWCCAELAWSEAQCLCNWNLLGRSLQLQRSCC
jgi:hypothetical protein